MFEKEVYRYTVSCGAPRAGKYVTKEEAMKQRLDKAEDEAKKDVYPLEKITTIVIEFLEKVGCENPVSLEIKNIADFLTPRVRSRKYNQLKEKYDLNNRKHLVWMKFTTDGYIGVVAASDDENLYKLWRIRLEHILHEFSGFGWGMEDFIADEYYSIPWNEED